MAGCMGEDFGWIDLGGCEGLDVGEDVGNSIGTDGVGVGAGVG